MTKSQYLRLGAVTLVGAALFATPSLADPFSFSTGTVNNLIATASRPGLSSGMNQETESADDFILSTNTRITSLSFTGLLPTGTALSSVSEVVAEVYRVFPNDSNVARTSGPPTFSTSQVPTRVNSPSDVALVSRDSAVAGDLSFSTTLLASSFTASNSIDTGVALGTGGQGAVTGEEVLFDVTLTSAFNLPADHYFFVPQVLLSDPNQHFLWLSASRPIDATGTAFLPDLQSWIRNAALQPDWMRIGTDVVARGNTFNAAFSLTGQTIPEPATLGILAAGLAGLGLVRRRRT